MDKRLSLKLNGGRTIVGVLRGFDPFMNLVVDETVEHAKTGEQNAIGMVVSFTLYTTFYKIFVGDRLCGCSTKS